MIGQQRVEIDGQTISTGDAFLRHSHFAPVVGAPVVSVPIGQTEDILQAGGMEIAGRIGDDRRVLAVARATSEALPKIRRPERIKPRPLPF